MSVVELPFGRGSLSARIPSENLIGVFPPRSVGQSAVDEGDLLRRALENPIGAPRLRDLARRGQKVALVTSDLTRPCPSDRLLPPVLAELSAAGIPDEDITIVLGLGLHRPMTEAELRDAVGEAVFGRVRVVNHDVRDIVSLGRTSFGTPVEIFRPVVDADFRVCLGNMEFHYFAGFSGGAKAIFPGCASEAAVTANHAMMVRPEAQAGRLEGNPVRADLEEASAMVGVDFILNVVVDGEHRIVQAVAGDVKAAHRVGCEWVSQRGKVPIPALADIVLVSAGGYPKDVNLYQAQKALDNAAYAVKPGGIIILVAECAEGCGNRTFEEWMTSGDTPSALLNRIQERFVLGGHKAAAVAVVAQKAQIFFVSPSMVTWRLAGMEPYDSLDAALAEAWKRMGRDATVIVLPEGGSVLPQPPAT
ncbi:MAG: nickel-dependent lactate racemase [Chloroflexi bacterium]|nr:nickel-dependent lactate racemase [Chloroflexota bacterium]